MHAENFYLSLFEIFDPNAPSECHRGTFGNYAKSTHRQLMWKFLMTEIQYFTLKLFSHEFFPSLWNLI